MAGLVDARAAEAAGFTEGLAKNTATLRWGYQPQAQAAAPNEQPQLSQQRLEGSAVGEASVAAAAGQESPPREAQVEASEQGATAEEPAASEGREDTPLEALAPELDVAPVDAARDAVVDEPARVLSARDAVVDEPARVLSADDAFWNARQWAGSRSGVYPAQFKGIYSNIAMVVTRTKLRFLLRRFAVCGLRFKRFKRF